MYTVYVGENGNNQGHFVGSYEGLHGAKTIAGKERKVYGGDGWSLITSDVNDIRILVND